MTQSLNYRPSNSAVYYKPPESFSLGRTAAAFAIAMLAVVVGAACYSKLVVYIDNFILRIGGVAVAAVITAVISHSAMRIGKVSTMFIAAPMGALLGTTALYVMWLVWVHDYINRSKFSLDYKTLVMHPSFLIILMRAINDWGTWTINDKKIRGAELLIAWVLEGGAMVGAAVVAAIYGVGEPEPECPSCRAKCVRSRGLPRFSVDRQSEMTAAAERHDFDSFATHSKAVGEDDPELTMQLSSCPRCEEFHVFTLNRIEWQIVNNQLKLKTIPLVNRLLITHEEAQTLKELKKRIEERASASPTLPHSD